MFLWETSGRKGTCGCQAVWRIFLLKSRQSTEISSFFLFPPEHTWARLNISFPWKSGRIRISCMTADLSRFEHCLWLGNLSRSLQRHFLPRTSVKHPAIFFVNVSASFFNSVEPRPKCNFKKKNSLLMFWQRKPTGRSCCSYRSWSQSPFHSSNTATEFVNHVIIRIWIIYAVV